MQEQTNVLIVDDESRIVRTLGRLLRTDYQTFPATSGEEALDILRNNQIHVILSDQRMPEMTGVELLSKVKELSKNTTRVLLTGYSDLEAVTNSVNQGEIFRYITKPWDNRDLLAVVDQAATVSHMLYQFKPVNDEAPVAEKQTASILALDPNNRLATSLNGLIGKKAEITAVSDPFEAMDFLATNDVNLIVAETSDAIADELAFIKVAKANYPNVLSIVIAEEGDSNRLISLINEGQVYRYLAQPYSLGQLKLHLMSALRYQKKLQESPLLAQRHQVEEIKDSEARKFGQRLLSRVKSFFKKAKTPSLAS